jgi:hypothetical protein
MMPSPTVPNGRDAGGRFSTGNKFARGRPLARRAQRLRVELFRAVTPEDLRAIVRALVDRARAGDTTAAREVLDRLLGKPEAQDLFAQLDELEDLLRGLREPASPI